MKYSILFFLFLFTSFTVFSQSQTVQDFESKSDGYNLYLYQSLIRMLNQEKNPEFNKLIKDLDHLRFITMTKQKSDNALDEFTSLDESIQAEGFESIMTFDRQDSKVHIYEFSTKKAKSVWVATIFVEGRAGLIEMVGSLNLKYINSLSGLDMERLQEMLPID